MNLFQYIVEKAPTNRSPVSAYSDTAKNSAIRPIANVSIDLLIYFCKRSHHFLRPDLVLLMKPFHDLRILIEKVL
jgi:hypothetical protein